MGSIQHIIWLFKWSFTRCVDEQKELKVGT